MESKKKTSFTEPQSAYNLLSLIKKQQAESKKQFLQSIQSHTFIKLDSQMQPQQLQPYRDHLYSNTLFSSTSSEAQLCSLIRQMHPTLKIDGRMLKVLKDFAKMLLQEIMEESVEVMRKMGEKEIDAWVVEQASWKVRERLWGMNSL